MCGCSSVTGRCWRLEPGPGHSEWVRLRTVRFGSLRRRLFLFCCSAVAVLLVSSAAPAEARPQPKILTAAQIESALLGRADFPLWIHIVDASPKPHDTRGPC